TSLHSYLLFHSVVELFTIVVATGLFVIAWNARAYLSNNYLLLVGLASPGVAVLDLVHTLAYKGMGVFGDPTADTATQLWIAARFLQALSLLAAPFFLGRRLRAWPTLVAVGAVTALVLLSIFYWRVFPAAYVEGGGLTRFKVVSEYVIAGLLLGAIGLLYWKREAVEADVRRLLALSLGLMIAAELAFTSYVSVYGGMNELGHLLRLVAFWILYKAVIETGFEKPYAILLRSLKLSREQLSEYAAVLELRNAELRRSEQLLREDALVLQRRNEELDAYAHTVAHDLKNPLAVIGAASGTIADFPDLPREKVQGLLRRIQSTTLSMSGIVDDLLLLAQVRRVEAPCGPVDMARVVARVRDRLSEAIRERAATVLEPESWPVALGYGPWLEEVWANYVVNAIRYGGEPPLVVLGAEARGDGTVRFWVSDNGAGIPPQERRQLFAPFTRLGGSAPGSSGLGLSIVSNIVEKLGGAVGVESEPGQGSTFWFTLPASAQAPVPAAQAVEVQAPPAGREAEVRR
ncbi:MAG TPA: MASE3 domain-containing protein, partial [Longimicrobiales bacterium]